MNASRSIIVACLVGAALAANNGCAGWRGEAPSWNDAWPATSGERTALDSAEPEQQAVVMRGQNAGSTYAPTTQESPTNQSPSTYDGYWRQPMRTTVAAPPAPDVASPPNYLPNNATPIGPPPNAAFQGSLPAPPAGQYGAPAANGYALPPAANGQMMNSGDAQLFPEFTPPPPLAPADPLVPPGRYVDVDAVVREARTGRFMFGVGVNSEAGLTGQIVIDERNFDIMRFPTSLDDFVNGTAWRGGGQGFRLEAVPGSEVQRYLASWTQPYLFGFMPISLNVSGFFFDRRYTDWDEQRLGGRLALGYRLTPDLSLSGAIRGERVDLHDPSTLSVPELTNALGQSDLFSGQVTLTHDTRDVPFAPTEGHLLELGFEQVFGSYDYPRADIDYRQYFLVRERPDGSGRHTLSYNFRLGFTGSQTPIFENYFAGGFSTMRGFSFRGASPMVDSVVVGGEFRFLGSVEYMFPLTADDMLKGVVFCDFGTVEEEIEINAEDYRVAPGFGLRIAIPALGPAPLALDLAFPVAHEDTDDIQYFSFFFGFGRG